MVDLTEHCGDRLKPFASVLDLEGMPLVFAEGQDQVARGAASAGARRGRRCSRRRRVDRSSGKSQPSVSRRPDCRRAPFSALS
jgi:hypothetical protein